LPGVDVYDGSDAYAIGEANSEDNPWVERDGNGHGQGGGEDKGVIEDFFDRLFGDEDRPPPPAPPPPRMGPRSSNDQPDDSGAAGVDADGNPQGDGRRAGPPPEPGGPYRQPEADPNAPPPF
jgi:hypothetical protein